MLIALMRNILDLNDHFLKTRCWLATHFVCSLIGLVVGCVFFDWPHGYQHIGFILCMLSAFVCVCVCLFVWCVCVCAVLALLALLALLACLPALMSQS